MNYCVWLQNSRGGDGGIPTVPLPLCDIKCPHFSRHTCTAVASYCAGETMQSYTYIEVTGDIRIVKEFLQFHSSFLIVLSVIQVYRKIVTLMGGERERVREIVVGVVSNVM